MSNEETHTGDDHGQSHGSMTKYLIVFGILVVLTAMSFLVGSNETIMQHEMIGWTFMMAISCAKALLVMLFFMHLIWEANWKYVLTIPASLMSVFLLIMLTPDVGWRTDHYSEERLIHSAEPQEDHLDDPSEDGSQTDPSEKHDDAEH